MSPDTSSSLRHAPRSDRRPAVRPFVLLLACGIVALLASATAASRVTAQTRGTAPSGVELAFSGPSVVVRGRPMHYRGVAYRVRGLATLEPFAAAVVHARYRWGIDHATAGPTLDLHADARGRFELDITPPSTWDESLELQIEIEDGDASRTFEMPMSDRSPYALLARTDRVLYEPSEPVHVWALVRDARSQRPLVGEHVRLEVTNGPLAGSVSEVTTAADGVASATFALPEEASEGSFTVRVQVGDEVTQLHPRVGTRTYSRLFARVSTEPELAAPGTTVVALVEATTPSGAPVRDARVTLEIDGQTEITGVTDEAGVARIPFTAPSYMPGDTSAIGVSATVHHAAHGEIFAHATLRLAVPMALSMMATSRIGAGLVPEVDDTFFLVVTDGAGEPPSSSVEIEVVGPSVRGGRATVRTDAAGIAEVPARLPAGTWAPGSDDDTRTTSVLATIHGPLERTARLSIAVQPEALVLPIVQSPIVQPGGRVEVRIERRPSVQRAELVAELLDGSEIVAVRRLGAGESRLWFDVPADRIGLLSVRVRPLEGDERAEGLGTLDTFLALPPQLGFPTLSADRPRYLVGETARLDVATSPAPPGVRTFAAVMVRDLAAHDGEVPFRSFFLERAFEEAVLAPSPTGLSVVRVALAARSVADEAGGDVPALLDPLGLALGEAYDGSVGADVLRDPFPWARELERRGVADVMRTVEELLVEALENDALDDVTTGTGAQRRFEDDLLADLGGATLGGGELTIAHLEAADPSFRYETVARRVARTRWVNLSSRLAMYLDPGDDAPISARMAAREPPDRWLPRMVERGLVAASDLKDPWGHQFVLVRVASPTFALSTNAVGLELVSPGPDGRPGTADDVRDPFARVVPAGTPYAVASGEDELLRRLSLLSPYERTLEELDEAYARIMAEMSEELIGDAVHAGVSEGALGLGNIGTIGHGSGSGYGAGGGGFRGRSARAPMVRSGSAAQYAFRGLAVVMRERFPATLLFRPSVELDASGRASVEVRLADAVTSYVVEAIVWRTDGWIWSADTRIEADREIVVEAPIPEVARTDDAIALPVRVGNRGRSARTLVVSVLEAEEIGLSASEPRTITVGAGDAVVETFVVHPTREAHGHVRVAVGTPEGDALDAIRLPIEVVARTRRVRRTLEMLSLGRGVIALEVPADATMRTGLVEVRVGEGLVVPPGARVFQHWAHVAGDPRVPSEPLDVTSEAELAWRVGVRWMADDVDDRLMSEAIDRLSRSLDQAVGEGTEPMARTAAVSRTLLALSPASITPDALARRPSGERLGELIARARGLVAENAAQITDDAGVLVLASAALAWSGHGDGSEVLANELSRRAERSIVSLGEDVFVASGSDPIGASALLALADARLGRPQRALAVISTLSRWTQGGLSMTDEQRAYTRVATAAVAARSRRATQITATLDGRSETRPAEDVVHLELHPLSMPGAHRLEIALDAEALVSARAVVTYGAPWPTAVVRGPFALALEGEVGALDATSELVLVVRNTTPRTVPVPIVEIDLPTGAELTAQGRTSIAARAGRAPDRTGDVLTITMTPLPPGAERRIPLPLRWSVGGTLVGLGVAAFAADRPDRATILPPRPVTIAPREEGGAR